MGHQELVFDSAGIVIADGYSLLQGTDHFGGVMF
jgi:hypothetical protein